METIRLTMSQALVKFLDNQYVVLDGKEYKFFEGMMGIFGHGNVLGLGQALEQYGEFPFYQGKNEQGIAHTAMAFAKERQRLQTYAVTASIGPGSANLVTAAATASVNRIPVLFLPSDNFASRRPDPVLQQVENNNDYTSSITDTFKPVSRYWDRIVRPEQLMTACEQAMRVLTDPADTGAVTLALPQDVQAEAYDYPVDFFRRRTHLIERQPLSSEALEKAVKIIEKSERPFIVCGGGVRYSGATEALLNFAETFRIPIGETQAGKGTIPWDHPLNMGGVGVCGTLASNRLAKDADVILAVGTRLNDFATSSKLAFKNDSRFVSLNVNATDASKMNAAALKGDAELGLNQLHDTLKIREYVSSYEEEIKIAWQAWEEELERLSSLENEKGLNQTRALMEINKMIDPSSVIVSASGSLPSDLERIWKPGEPNTYHLEYGFSCMGYEVPGALGAKIAKPDSEVYAFVGDGAYLMGHTEVFTSIQEGLKMNILLFDNHGFQCIHNLQRSHGVSSFGNEFRRRENHSLTGEYSPVDFAKNAESYGMKAFTVTNLEELQAAFEESKKETQSTLIHIKVLPGTMTEGYEGFWEVGVPEVSESAAVQESYQELKVKLDGME
ncbi:3D-(3,5/4)-trihydroxycyclohexane-1,2-dione acylhydrolase (decyclizing) [Halobacillus sp. Cin3]|uniref:3D-(3,5/4)-trihydroxycyclohexane-1,2-dione acylhydrolase (decyclizing) n=1 Tax=Halobacillus sp. Cin3 TaxID=2928441 RepID=UPI00248D5257|nr:3D-(3,5/4)-trihydroxycyclohexane-1,2-dione acylhydrolase (decyclizing) [Halobacillus sp. Cin3]